eukprot:4040134-Prymnesium_polylepis.1
MRSALHGPVAACARLRSKSARLLQRGHSSGAVVADASLPSLAPPAQPLSPPDLHSLVAHISAAERLLVVTGAGISTASGIPDYRSPRGSYSRGHKPIQHMELVLCAAARQRYWTQSFVGWRYFSRAQPNAAHTALAALEARGHVRAGLITQNVDGLHSAAGHAEPRATPRRHTCTATGTQCRKTCGKRPISTRV